MNKIIDQVLNKIQTEKIKPISKWKFWLRDGGQWFGFGLFIFLVAIVVGLLWYFWSDGPWIHGGQFGFQLFFGRAPMFLMGIIAIVAILGLLEFYNTKQGYRYSRIKVVSIILIFVCLAGWLVYHFGVSARMDQSLGNIPFYQSREMYMKEVWQHPENGLIAGEIIKVENKNFSLRDFNGKQWQIDASNTIWRHNLSAQLGTQVKLIGKVRENIFIAEEVRPWMGMGNCQMTGEVGMCGMMGSERKK